VFYKEGFLSIIVAATVLSSQANQTKILPGHVPAEAVKARAIQRLDRATNLSLSVGLPLRNREALTNLLDQLYDPGSTNYHRFVSPEEFTAQFGPTEAEYARVLSFLQTNGFAVAGTHPNRVVLDVTAPVARIEKAFHVHINKYHHPKENRDFYAPDANPMVDQDVSILQISGLDNFIVPHPAGKKQRVLNTGAASGPLPLAGSGPSGSYMGNDFRNAYAPGVSLTGAGQSVALLQFDGYYPADISAYRARSGLPNVPLTNVLLNNITGVGADNDEVALDIEMVMSMAPGLSNIIVYEGLSGNTILSRIATDNLAKQISASWTFGANQTTDQIFQQFAAQGQSYFNASGDSDAYVGTIDTPCDSPYITAVGGTTLSTRGAATWSSETVWNWGNDSGSGGGISTRYGLPSWQQGLNMAANQGSSAMRNIPDVAMIADNVFVVADNGSQYFMGGTSVASPLWAAFTALINQQAVANGHAPVGFLNPALYAIGKGANYNSAFHDIQSGNNTSSTSPNLFPATEGYDLATGWGTPKGAGLINLLAPLSAATAPTITSQPTNLAVAVGAKVMFSVAASGTAPLSYQWRFNGGNVAGATGSSISLSNVQTNQAGAYLVLVSNSGGSVVSSAATLRVLVSPAVAFTKPSVGATNVSLSVQSVAGVNYTLQYKNSMTDATWTSILPTVAGNGGSIVLQDPQPPTLPSRFYRVISN
jgi:subtilase family serine protease